MEGEGADESCFASPSGGLRIMVGTAAAGPPAVAAVEAVAAGLDIAAAQIVAAQYIVGECFQCVEAAVLVDTVVAADGDAQDRDVQEAAPESDIVACAVAAAVDKAADVVAEAAGAAHDEVAVVFEPVADSPDCSAGSHVGTSGSLAPRLRWRCPCCTYLAAQPC